jgi:hypothetical protein
LPCWFCAVFLCCFYIDTFPLPIWHWRILHSFWWWTDKLSEACRVSCQNKFVKLVHLVGFIVKKLGNCLSNGACDQWGLYRVCHLSRIHLQDLQTCFVHCT